MGDPVLMNLEPSDVPGLWEAAPEVRDEFKTPPRGVAVVFFDFVPFSALPYGFDGVSRRWATE